MTTPVLDTSHPSSDSHSVSAIQESVTPSSSVTSERSIPPPPPESLFPYSYPFLPPYSYYYPTYQSYTPPFMYPCHSPPWPRTINWKQPSAESWAAPTSSTVIPPTGITSQSTTSGKCHQYVYLILLPLLQWLSLLLAYHWLTSQPPTGSSSSFSLSLPICDSPLSLPALLQASSWGPCHPLTFSTPYCCQTSQQPQTLWKWLLSASHHLSAAPILGQWRLPSLHKLPAYPSKAGPEN